MSNPNLIMTLGKVIIAAAWADGEISAEEINSLKDLLFRLPELNASQWATLEIYLESPVDAAERARLLDDLQRAISNSADKAFAVNALDELIRADGLITGEEKDVFEEVVEAIENADTGIVGLISRMIKSPIQRRSDAVARAPNRETHIEDFIKNKVYYNVRRRLELGSDSLNIPDDQLRKLSLAGGLMAHIARVDSHIHEDEIAAIVRALQSHWNLTEEEAVLVAEVATSRETANLDYFRTAREFVAVCTHEELAQFITVLFEIAAADDMATRDEIEEIRLISRSLLLSHEQFIEAKLTIPREKRET